MLIAESGGAVVAARSLADGTVAADPFRRTAHAVAALRARAAELGAAGTRRRFQLAFAPGARRG
jgi:hypothetical protein